MTINIDVLNPVKWGCKKAVSAFAAITVDPLFDLANYIFPSLGAYFNGRSEIEAVPGTSAANRMIDEKVSQSLHTEIKAMTDSAGLKGSTRLYTSLNAPYEGNGSFSGRALIVPLEEVHKLDFKPEIQSEQILSKEDLTKHKKIFTDNEIRFQFARSIGKMSGYSFLKIAARVVIVAMAVALLFSPFGLAGWVLFLGSALLYCAVDRYIEESADERGVKILAKRFEKSGFSPLEAQTQAHTAAINCLGKIALLNADKRANGKLCRFLINEEGGLRFDPTSPTPARRIKRLHASLLKHESIDPLPNQMLIAPSNYC